MTIPDKSLPPAPPPNRRLFIVLLAGLFLVLFLFMISGLLIGVVGGIILWTITDGIFQRLAKKLRRGMAATVSLLITLMLFILPIAILVTLMAFDAATFAQRAQQWFEPYRPEIETRVQEFMRGGSLYVFDYRITAADVMERLDKASGQITGFLLGLVQKTAGGVAQGILQIFVALYTLFFLYLDGAIFLEWLKKLLPVTKPQADRLFDEFLGTCKASLKTLIVIGLVQGTMGGVAFWICGIPAPFFWTMLMAAASVIPAVGAQIILVPAAILMMIVGKVGYGVGLLLWSLIVVANIDNFLRPYLVKREINLHQLLVFLGTLGGIATFGFFGVILGPVIAALLKTSLQIYGDLYHRDSPI
jgi:predicted PurR-regulated permease PerM